MLSFRYGFTHPPELEVDITPCLGADCTLVVNAENDVKGRVDEDFTRSKDKGGLVGAALESMRKISDRLEKVGVMTAIVQAVKERMKKEIVKIYVLPNMGNAVLPYFEAPPWLRKRASHGKEWDD